MIKNILLTGGTGFLGSSILKKLVSEGYNVIVSIRKTSDLYRIQNISGSFELFCIEDQLNNVEDLFKRYEIDTIIHTATEYGRNSLSSSIFKTNLIFPILLIEQGLKQGLKYFINTDSFFGKEEFISSSYLGDYTNSKKYFLNYLVKNTKDLKVVNMRLEHVFGEYDSENKFVTSVLHQLINNEKEILLTKASQRRDFVYVDDVVGAYLKVISNISKIENLTEFEIGRGESVPVSDFVKKLLEISGSTSQLNFGAIPTRIGEIQESKANLTKLKEIGWESNFDLKSAISKMIEIEKG